MPRRVTSGPIDPSKIKSGLLYPTKEVATLLNLSPAGVRGLVFRGKLRARKVGNRLLIKGADLLAYLGENPSSED